MRSDKGRRFSPLYIWASSLFVSIGIAAALMSFSISEGDHRETALLSAPTGGNLAALAAGPDKNDLPSPRPSPKPTAPARTPAPVQTSSPEPSSSPGKKYIALTFDDGPNPETTGRVLDILEEQNARVTFFVLGESAKRCSETIKRMSDMGNEVANHSWNHAWLTKYPEKEMTDQIRDTNAAIKEITGKTPTLFRPPYGAYDDRLRGAAGKQGMALVMWSVDTRDWESRDADKVAEKCAAEVADRDIVIMHDTHGTTADAVERVIKNLKDGGFTIVTASELLRMNGVPVPGEMYWSGA
ncbi:MAG: polysaccharide deacetylase family protein [Clostridiales bacterium]|jgi:peptidoglycan/xylan/chitin deacetylase (PgdA/CDA1 family)|nr:polysaccharide deacetylase family protein [Clostridiales bacterium]